MSEGNSLKSSDWQFALCVELLKHENQFLLDAESIGICREHWYLHTQFISVEVAEIVGINCSDGPSIRDILIYRLNKIQNKVNKFDYNIIMKNTL